MNQRREFDARCMLLWSACHHSSVNVLLFVLARQFRDASWVMPNIKSSTMVYTTHRRHEASLQGRAWRWTPGDTGKKIGDDV